MLYGNGPSDCPQVAFNATLLNNASKISKQKMFDPCLVITVHATLCSCISGFGDFGFELYFALAYRAIFAYSVSFVLGKWREALLLQVDSTGKAWLAGKTKSALDGNANAGKSDIFVMTFDADGNHLWTRQRGGASYDEAKALQVGRECTVVGLQRVSQGSPTFH